MALGDFAGWPHPQPVLTQERLPVWHVHQWDAATGKFGPTSFNPFASGRFAARLARRPRAMYYAGSTPSVALWETVLRDVEPQGSQREVRLDVSLLKGTRLSPVFSRKAMSVLELFPLSLRRQAGHPLGEEWLELTTTGKHAYTHGPTASLLNHLEESFPALIVDGFVWESRQCGTAREHPKAYVFFDPPCGASSFDAWAHCAPLMLDSASGRRYLERAVDDAGMRLVVVDDALDDALTR
ncbi:MAG TPA: RES domain-containing protein [Tahibacter sp.]|nr:RES domain-containing protein [Tahibacter sp.]